MKMSQRTSVPEEKERSVSRVTPERKGRNMEGTFEGIYIIRQMHSGSLLHDENLRNCDVG
jgi:hypothetical protein